MNFNNNTFYDSCTTETTTISPITTTTPTTPATTTLPSLAPQTIASDLLEGRRQDRDRERGAVIH